MKYKNYNTNNNSIESVIIFDIETIPDVEVVKRLCKLDNSIDYSELELRQKMEEYHLSITDNKNSFPRQLFHRVLCISFIEAQIDLQDGKEFHINHKITTYSSFESSEKDMITKFWNHMKQIKPKIISFNGKSFDMPVLKYRALKYGINCDWFFNFGDKWSNYNQKYSESHSDLIDVLSDFGTSAKIKMSEVCALLNIPCKVDEISGSSVSQMYDDKRFHEIREYCENDVIATYLIYLRFLLISGKLEQADYDNTKNDLFELLLKHNSKIYDLFKHS